MKDQAYFDDRSALSIDDIPIELLAAADAVFQEGQDHLPEQAEPQTEALPAWLGVQGWEEVHSFAFNAFDDKPEIPADGFQLRFIPQPASGDLPIAPIRPIGRVANTGYSCASDIKSIADYFNIIHRGRPGVRFVGRKLSGGKFFSQTSQYWSGMAGKGIQRKMRQYAGQDDVYISMNLMLNKRKGNDNIKRLMALYVDLDCYHVGLTPEQAYEAIRTQYSFIRIPAPSVAVSSGRGLQLVWLIDEDPRAVSRWETVERWLCDQLTELGADCKVTDPSRYLRMPFTRNSKGGNAAVIDFIDVCYTLHEIISAYGLPGGSHRKKAPKNASAYPFGTATRKMRKTASDVAARLGLPCPDFGDFQETCRFIGEGLEKIKQLKGTAPSRKKERPGKPARINRGGSGEMDPAQIRALADARIEDLKILATLRKGVDCGREYILFLVRYFAAETTGDYGYALDLCKEVNQLFECPLAESEVTRATASAEKILARGGRYRYSNARIIEVLNITPEELRHLHYLCPTACAERKKEWDRKRKQKAYRNKLEKTGALTVSEKISQKVNALAELSVKGLARDAICAELEISKATFYRYKKMAESMAKEIAPDEKADIPEQDVVNSAAEAKAEKTSVENQKGLAPCIEIINAMKVGYRKTSPFPLIFKEDVASQNSVLIFSPLSIIKAPQRGAASPQVCSELTGENAYANIRAVYTGSWVWTHNRGKKRKVDAASKSRGCPAGKVGEAASLRRAEGGRGYRPDGRENLAWKAVGPPGWTAPVRGSLGRNSAIRARTRGNPAAVPGGFEGCWGNVPPASRGARDGPLVRAGGVSPGGETGWLASPRTERGGPPGERRRRKPAA